MCEPAGIHITRIFVNYSRQTPSPIRSTCTVPVHTSTPIINVGASKPSPKQQMALLAREILASQRSTETFTYKRESPPSPSPAPVIPAPSSPPSHPLPPPIEEYVFISKETGQEIDVKTGDGIGRISNVNPEAVGKKKKQRQSLAVVPPPASARSSKSSDDGDYSVPMNNNNDNIRLSKETPKPNFISYDGLQKFTFTLDDD